MTRASAIRRTLATSSARRSTRRRMTMFAAVHLLFSGFLALILPGCRSLPETYEASRPTRHTVKTDAFTVFSDVDLPNDSPVIRELTLVGQQVQDELQLPPQRDSINIYLFPDEAAYRSYMHVTWSHLPPRRAYFVGSSRELAVYSFLGPSVQEDLRHEFTHGLLHSCLETVPLWLDEGLAEYFEVGGATVGLPHRSHLRELQEAAIEGWSPNLYRLELMHDFRDLTQRDYAESWVWVHFLLNGEPAVRQMFLTYISQLQTARVPQRLLNRVEEIVPSWQSELRKHIELLQSTQSDFALQ